MNEVFVVLKSIEIINIKNVQYGNIDFQNSMHNSLRKDSKITAIYGQNGSGKTVLIDCLCILKSLLSGQKLQEDLNNYINVSTNTADIKYNFLIKYKNKEVNVYYELGIINENQTFLIDYEKLSYTNSQKSYRKNTIIQFEDVEDINIKPISIIKQVKSYSKKTLLNLYVNAELAKKEHLSYIFNERNIKLLNSVFAEGEFSKNNKDILDALHTFADVDLFIIQNYHTGFINMKQFMPLSFRIENSKDVVSGNLITLFKTNTVDEEKIQLLNDIIHQVNIVINTIIPGLSIGVIQYGRSLNRLGQMQVEIELVSQHAGKNIPLKYESDGIKKILSMLSTIIAVYNNESTCLVIDEIDSGIFEYLLGELLGILQDNIKGQLILTSHNLRILEKINKENIVFTTSNEKNRYIRVCKNTNHKNFRDYYLKTISLGGESEKLYNETSPYEIAYALRKAGQVIHEK